MLNLEPPEEHVAVAEVAKSIGLEVISPSARDAEQARNVPVKLWKSIMDSGLVHPVPEGRGGAGVPDAVTHLIAVEKLSYGDPGVALAAAWSGAAAFLLGRHGTARHDALLARLTSDPDARGSVAIYEGYGRGPAEYGTTFTVSGDTVQIRGRKVGVPFAGNAAAIIVVGRDSETGKLRAAAVPADAPGVLVEPHPGGLGLDAAGMAPVTFDVPAEASDLVGGVAADADALANSVERIRLLAVAAGIGVSQRAIDYASQYAVERVAFKRPIAAFQGVSFPLAEAQMRVAELREEIADVAVRLDDLPAVDHSAAVSRLASYAGEVACETTRTAVQTLGGHGFIADHPVETWYRAAAALSALDFDLSYSVFQPAL